MLDGIEQILFFSVVRTAVVMLLCGAAVVWFLTAHVRFAKLYLQEYGVNIMPFLTPFVIRWPATIRALWTRLDDPAMDAARSAALIRFCLLIAVLLVSFAGSILIDNAFPTVP